MRKKDDEKQLNIKRAVIRLILEEGFHGVSIAKIARAAGVSPATVYVYYSSKEAMLYDIYLEYGNQIYSYLLARVNRDMDGRQFIEVLIRAYYNYIIEYGEAFFFVEQFTSCPALVGSCKGLEGKIRIGSLFEYLKSQQVIKNFDNCNISALLFNPVKSIAVQYHLREKDADPILTELISIIQDALLL